MNELLEFRISFRRLHRLFIYIGFMDLEPSFRGKDEYPMDLKIKPKST